MDEQFDKNLTDRVKEVFENYDDGFAHEGWLKLRKKFPDKRRRRPVAWWWLATAAALLLFFGLGLWLNKEDVQPKKLAFKKINTIKAKPPLNLKEHGEKKNDLNAGDNPVNEEKVAGIRERNERTLTIRKREIAAGQNKTFDQQQHDELVKALQHPVSASDISKTNLSKQIADSVNHRATNEQEEQLVENARPKMGVSDSAKHTPLLTGKSINSMFAQDQQLSKSNRTEKQKSDAKKVRFA